MRDDVVCLSFSHLCFTPLTCCINRKRGTHTHLGDCHTTASGDGIPVLREIQCHLHGKVTFVFSLYQDLRFSCLLHIVVFPCISNSVTSTEAFFFYMFLHSLTFCKPNCVFVVQLSLSCCPLSRFHPLEKRSVYAPCSQIAVNIYLRS